MNTDDDDRADLIHLTPGEVIRISRIIATVLLVLLGGVAGYYLGTQQRHVEPDAWGVPPLRDMPSAAKIAFSNRYDCEVIAVSAKIPECEPLTFAQVHAAGFRLIPREIPRDSRGDSNESAPVP